MNPETSQISRIYIHRRFVVRFLIAMLIVLSVLSFASIAFGWGRDAGQDNMDSGTPTQLADTSPFYVLLIGNDSLEGTALYTGEIDEDKKPVIHAEAITLARMDPRAFTITLVTVPSNTVLYDSDEQVRDSMRDGGPEQTVYTVERITGVDVRYYFMLDYNGFEEVVKRMGRVTADVPATFRIQDPVTAKPIVVKKGENRELNAAEALGLARAWWPYENDFDAHRQLNVRTMETDLINRTLGSDDEKVRKVLGTFEKNCNTNIDKELLISLVTRFYENKDAVTIYSCTGPYLTTSISENGEPIIRQPPSAWRELMTVVDAGEDPAAAFPMYDFKHSEGETEAETQGKAQ
jgi:anionic cell wall polymer biosynthesis LytR-Cps2A-Psr (LCP) family protein